MSSEDLEGDHLRGHPPPEPVSIPGSDAQPSTLTTSFVQPMEQGHNGHEMLNANNAVLQYLQHSSELEATHQLRGGRQTQDYTITPGSAPRQGTSSFRNADPGTAEAGAYATLIPLSRFVFVPAGLAPQLMEVGNSLTNSGTEVGRSNISVVPGGGGFPYLSQAQPVVQLLHRDVNATARQEVEGQVQQQEQNVVQQQESMLQLVQVQDSRVAGVLVPGSFGDSTFASLAQSRLIPAPTIQPRIFSPTQPATGAPSAASVGKTAVASPPQATKGEEDTSKDDVIFVGEAAARSGTTDTSSTSSTPKNPKPRKPKRPLSPYNIFFREERKKLLRELNSRKSAAKCEDERNCGGEEELERRKGKAKRNSRKPPHYLMTFQEMGREIGRRWQALADQERTVFKELAADDRIRYERELEEYKKARAGHLHGWSNHQT